jgi:peptide-methionine (S)-S-oxide reductase
MRHILAFLALCLSIFALSAPATAQQAPPRRETAIFAGGCFWCMEHDMKAIPGVIRVDSGYSGGRERNPTYEQVSSHRTGHYEVVRVTYDANRISYAQLLERYWPLVDPTDDEGQFCDKGPQYRTAIFATPAQKPIADASLARLRASGRVNGTIVTPVLPAGEFWIAEEYHRDYAENNTYAYNRYRTGCGRDVVLRQVWRQPQP